MALSMPTRKNKMNTTLGALIVDIQGVSLSEEDKELLAHPLVGGVILFARNHESHSQLANLCSAIRAACVRPLLIMADQEGGRVQRFKKDFTILPAMGELGKLYDAHTSLALELARECAWVMATELLASGVDLSLAPVLDLNNKISQVIGERAFHAHPQPIIELAQAYISGMKEAGMAAIGKHFPGHGSIASDSHLALPVDERRLSEIEQHDMLPFSGMIQRGLLAVMAAHIVFPNVDALPVGFSRFWLQQILLEKLKFKGTIFSDDLNMEGANISANFSERVSIAREAGCDFTLLCNNRNAVIQVLDNLPYLSHQVSREKWQTLQGDFSSIDKSFKQNKRWQKYQESLRKEFSVYF